MITIFNQSRQHRRNPQTTGLHRRRCPRLPVVLLPCGRGSAITNWLARGMVILSLQIHADIPAIAARCRWTFCGWFSPTCGPSSLFSPSHCTRRGFLSCTQRWVMTAAHIAQCAPAMKLDKLSAYRMTPLCNSDGLHPAVKQRTYKNAVYIMVPVAEWKRCLVHVDMQCAGSSAGQSKTAKMNSKATTFGIYRDWNGTLGLGTATGAFK